MRGINRVTVDISSKPPATISYRFQNGNGVIESLGNNTVRQNGTNTSGTITPVAPI